MAEKAQAMPLRAPSGAQTIISAIGRTISMRQRIPLAWYPSSLDMSINGFLFSINKYRLIWCKSTKKYEL
jgi:hypothetical protein